MNFISMENEFQMPDSVPIFGVSPFIYLVSNNILPGSVCSTLLIGTVADTLSLPEEKDNSVQVS